MIRKIIMIDKEKCNGCGKCVNACHEGAIALVDGKATLVKEHFCDGLGDCLPVCPVEAISFEEREASAYDENSVRQFKEEEKKMEKKLACGCSSAEVGEINSCDCHEEAVIKKVRSRLKQWPCQIKLVPVDAPFLDGAKLLIAADCTAYAYGNFHDDLMKGKITLVGCPKLDGVDYSEKLTEIIRNNDIKSVTIVRMEVPCCGSMQKFVETALKNSGKFIPWQVITISKDGKIID